MKYETLYAMDIVNPFTKTVKMEGLAELNTRIIKEACWDKVGEDYYKISRSVEANEIPDTDLVVKFLNELHNRPTTRERVGFKLDESGV